jgi:hypothetical protein
MRKRVLGLLCVVVAACGGGAKTETGSQIAAPSSGGAAGQAGMGLSLAVGGGGASAGGGVNAGGGASGTGIVGLGGSSASGGASSIVLHSCPAAPDPSCPTKVFTGDYFSGSNTPDQLQGVTEVTGQMNLDTPEDLAPLSCLETVDDDLSIDLFTSDVPVSLWPLRNLKKTGGGVDISSGFAELWVDCGFSQLQSLGEKYATGGAVDASDVHGLLDLSKVQKVTHIRIKSSQLTQVTLPSGVALAMGQLWFDTNPLLTTVDGFANVTLTQTGITGGGIQSVRIVDNPGFSTCRANALKALFVAAGFSADAMLISGNQPDCN